MADGLRLRRDAVDNVFATAFVLSWLWARRHEYAEEFSKVMGYMTTLLTQVEMDNPALCNLGYDEIQQYIEGLRA